MIKQIIQNGDGIYKRTPHAIGIYFQDFGMLWSGPAFATGAPLTVAPEIENNLICAC
jgi:hypothetical protein